MEEIEVYEDEDFEEYEDDIQYTEDAAETETSEDAAEPEETDDAEDEGIQYVDEDDADRGDEIEE